MNRTKNKTRNNGRKCFKIMSVYQLEIFIEHFRKFWN